MSRLRVYLQLFVNEAISHAAYRFNTFLGTASRIVFIFVQFAIWRALYGGRDVHADRLRIRFASRDDDLRDCSARRSAILIYSDVIERIDQRIKSGEIAIDFIRPISHLLYHLAGVWGGSLYSTVVQLVPMAVLVIAIVGIELPPTTGAGLLCLALVPGASLLLFLMSYTLGLVGFWHMSVWQLGAYLWMLIRLCSGAFIPLWFFPDWLVAASDYLPFRLLYFAPIATWLGKITPAEAAVLVAQQWLWIGALLVLQRVLWLAGVRKVVVQGG